MLKDIVNDFNVSNRSDSTTSIIISVPLDLKVMTSINQVILNGFCGDADNREVIEGGKLFNINISELKYEPLEEGENLSMFTPETTIKTEYELETVSDHGPFPKEC